MISTESNPVTSVNAKIVMDRRKVALSPIRGRLAPLWGLIMVSLIVGQLNYTTVSGAALTTASGNNSDMSMKSSSNVVITEVAPPSSSTIDSGSTTSEPEDDDNAEDEKVREFTKPPFGINISYSSIRENTPGLPKSCANYEIFSEQDQPQFTGAPWNKCCPEGKVLTMGKTCEKVVGIPTAFRVPIINATFYSDCIEDSEIIDFYLPTAVYLPQNKSVIYNEREYNDQLYILQNGSLLIVFEDMQNGYSVFSDYCLDIDPESHTFFALVVSSAVSQEIVTGIVLSKFYKGIAFIMAISFCCLLVTSALYMIVPRFGTLHGRSFALHTLNLALGYVFTATMYFKWDGSSRMEGNEYLQYFVSAAFMWQATMCVDTLINVWYYIPKKISPIEGRYRGWIHFGIYVFFSQSIPFLFIIHHDKDSAPVNYYMSTLGEENHNEQWKFFGPIFGIIVLCIGMFAAAYYGFRRLNSIQSLAYIIRMKLRKRKCEQIEMPFCSKEMDYVKDSARSTCFLFAIQSLCFMSEMITFYTTNDSSIFFELLNALQGVFILVLFVMFPKPLMIIRQCWAGDQGSLVIDQTNARRPMQRELEEMPLKGVTEEKA